MRLKFAILLSVLLLGCAAPARAFIIVPPPQTRVYEYYNTIVDRYLLLSDPTEIALVDSGGAGPGWKRTQYEFSGFLFQDWRFPIYPVYRFYAPGVNSHFHTAQEHERQVLLNDPAWIFERIDFYSYVPQADGSCASQLLPVWRLYNNRAQSGNPDHRYTPDVAVRDSLVAQGWIDEGVNFCTTSYGTPTSEVVKLRVYQNPLSTYSPPKLCADPSVCAWGAWLDMENVAPLTNSIGKYLSYPTPNPLYASQFDGLTHFWVNGGTLFTSESPNDSNAVLGDSYVQDFGLSGFPSGIHLVAAKRTAGTSAAMIPTYTVRTSGAGQVLPFADGRPHTILLSIDADLATVRAWAGSAQGAIAIRFVDQVSGSAIDISVFAFGTGPAADSMTFDAANKVVKAATSFKDAPSFGHVYSGSYVQCNGWACGRTGFAYGIDQTQFGELVAAARGLNPALSPDIRNYVVADYRFENRASLDGEIGVTFRNYTLEVYGLWYDNN